MDEREKHEGETLGKETYSFEKSMFKRQNEDSNTEYKNNFFLNLRNYVLVTTE